MQHKPVNQHHLLHELLPYRMRSVAILNFALSMRSKWPDAPPMTIHVNGDLVVEGNLNAFTNPAVEAGLIHCRALLEFLGLRMIGKAKLGTIAQRRPDDIGIEHFETATGHLAKVPPDEAVSRYDGGLEEAEAALVSIFQLTNKGLAHLTADLMNNPEHGRLIEAASRGVLSLVISHLYTPLGLPPPDYKLSSRLRNSAASGAARPLT
jgi:hypothetical protein